MSADRERRLGPEDVEAYVRAHDREIRANLAAELDDTLERLRLRGPAPVWSGTSATLLEDLQRVAHEARRSAWQERRRVEPIELTREAFDALRARVGLAPDTSPAVAMPVISGTLYGVPLRVLPPATPVGAFVGQVDDVLADWHGSPDAVSWHPDGVYPHPIGPRRGPRPAQGLTPQQLERLAGMATTIGEQLQRFVMTAAEAVQQIVENLRELGYTVTPPTADADPVDPREHALAMRRRRNTGPPLPPPGARGRRMGR